MNTRAELIEQGLDPHRSVVIEACAGSGKTWLLVSRILRILLSGAKPAEVLAITFTRKAAREIEERLRQWLELLARANDVEVHAFLLERGVVPAQLPALLPHARKLFESVLWAQPAITISTFHGWFTRLLSAAPLDSELRNLALSDSSEHLLDTAWATLARRCARQPQSALAQSLLWLYAEVGGRAAQRLIAAVLSRRAEWDVWLQAMGGSGQEEADLHVIFDRLAEYFAVHEAAQAMEDFFSPATRIHMEEYAALLGRNTDSDRLAALRLVDALQVEMEDAQRRLDAVADILLTREGTPRVRKASGAQAKRLGAGGEERLLRLHADLSAQAVRVLAQRADLRAYELNRHALRVAYALMQAFDRVKSERRVMDYADLEGYADRLLTHPLQGALVQARLDARYKHILLDEFQDTNPLQWRIVRAWLDAYGADGARPSLFLVGDPKQSIYRFRRAEPRLFKEAADFLQQRFAAVCLHNDATRRNAPQIVETINALFSQQSDFPGFRDQIALRKDLPGRVEIVPMATEPLSEGLKEETPDVATFRNPLFQAMQQTEDKRRATEAQQLVERLQAVIGYWPVRERDGTLRPARYGDVMLLSRRSRVFESIETALRQANIPYLSVGRGGLLERLEAQDVIALLRALAHPADDLTLMHVLRTPIFDATEAQLLRLSQQPGSHAWDKLDASAQEDRQFKRARDLLIAWREAAQHLPVHDLLDRMFHEGDILQCYRARVPMEMWLSVRANFDRLFELSLDIDGGRYPSLPRFLDEVKRISQDENIAPSEGLIRMGNAVEERQGRVRLMTIHAAKGLEAPIVWLLDANNIARNNDSYGVVMDWPPQADVPQHFSVLASNKDVGYARSAIMDAENRAAAREELNLLYVAITRAEQYFFASGCESRRNGEKSSHYTHLMAALTRLGCDGGSYGALPETLTAQTHSAPALMTHSAPLLQPRRVGERRVVLAQSVGQRFGTDLHAWLEAYTGGLPLPAVSAEVESSARALSNHPALRAFFDPACYIWARNEAAFVLPDGSVGRIDRLVDDGRQIWVLDYKTGQPDTSQMQAYRSQVHAYMRALNRIYPHRAVRGALIFADAHWEDMGELCD